MKFYARLSPGVTNDLATPVELIVHQPRQPCPGVVVKVWELATFVDLDGKVVEEEGSDDLLVELHGGFEPDAALRSQGRVRFRVDQIVMPPRDAKAALDSLSLRVGDQTISCPIPSTDGEHRGQNFEIAITIENGGSEVFRSKVPMFVRPEMMNPRAAPRALIGFDEAEQPIYDDDDQPVWVAGRFATLGVADGEGDAATLHVLGLSLIGEDGRLGRCTPEGEPLEGELTLVRTRRDLHAHVTRKVPKAAGQPGPSTIPLALCYPVAPDGAIEMDVMEPHAAFLFTRVGDVLEHDDVDGRQVPRLAIGKEVVEEESPTASASIRSLFVSTLGLEG